MTRPEHLFAWIRKQTHIRHKAYTEASGIDKSTFSKLVSGERTPNNDHYDKLLPFAKKIGYKASPLFKPMEKRKRS